MEKEKNKTGESIKKFPGKETRYHPGIELEYNEEVISARNCEDRFSLIFNFLIKNGVDIKEKSILDIGSNSGYFVNKFYNHSSNSYGVEISKRATDLCINMYPNLEGNIHNEDFLQMMDREGPFDIVLFMSLLHRYILKKKDYVEIIKTVEKNTKDFLFFEMGQEHEDWYKNSLSGWNKEKIQELILENTSFNFCEYLGKDSDSTGEFEGNFGRDLFVCYRTG